MKKLLLLLLCVSSSVFAVTSVASAPAVAKASPVNLNANQAKNKQCMAARAQIKATHEKVMAAFKVENACQIGKLQLQNRKIIKDNIDCFPQMKAQMARGQF